MGTCWRGYQLGFSSLILSEAVRVSETASTSASTNSTCASTIRKSISLSYRWGDDQLGFSSLILSGAVRVTVHTRMTSNAINTQYHYQVPPVLVPEQLVLVPVPSGRVSVWSKMGRLSAGIISDLVRCSESDGAYEDDVKPGFTFSCTIQCTQIVAIILKFHLGKVQNSLVGIGHEAAIPWQQ